MGDVLVKDEAFEKWSEETRFRFVGDFRDAYNTEQGTCYQITDASLKDAQDYDFTLTDGKEILKIQHTFAAADPENEYIGPKLQTAIITKLYSDLKHLKNVFVNIGFKNIQSKKDACILTTEIENIINNLINSRRLGPSTELKSVFHYRWTDELKPTVSQYISDFLTELSVYSSPYDQITFGYGGQSVAMMSDDVRADKAIRKKEGHYANPQDIILIVHYNFPFFGDFFEPAIKQKHSESPFKGVWIFDAWKDKFILIK